MYLLNIIDCLCGVCVYVCGGVRVHMAYIHISHGAHLEIRGQFVGVGSLLPHRSQG